MKKNILLAYAAQNWGNHARKASSHDTITDELIVDFLGRGANLAFSTEVIRYFLLDAASPTDGAALNFAACFDLEKTVLTLRTQRQSRGFLRMGGIARSSWNGA